MIKGIKFNGTEWVNYPYVDGKAIAIELANSGFEVIINFSKSKEKAKEVQ